MKPAPPVTTASTPIERCNLEEKPPLEWRPCSSSSSARAGSDRPWRNGRSSRATRCRSSTRTPCRRSAWTPTAPSRWEDAGGQFTVGTALEIEALMRGRPRAGRRVHRLHRRRQHEPRGRADRAEAFQRPEGDRARARPGPRRVVRASRACTRSARPRSRSRCSRRPSSVTAGLMYVIVAGAGKVGWNLARELIEQGPRGHADRVRPRAAT